MGKAKLEWEIITIFVKKDNLAIFNTLQNIDNHQNLYYYENY